MALTNLLATAVNALLLYYLPMDLAVIFVVLVTGLANVIVTYLSTESGVAPPSSGGTAPVQIVPLNWARLKSRIFHLAG